MLSFDHFLSERLGFGKFQIKTFLIVSFIDFLDGAEIQYLSFLNVILMKEWELDLTGLILLAASFNLGLFIGAIICALQADKIGRRNILIFGSFLQFFTVLLTAFAQNLFQMLLLRVSYGLIFGITIPISQILMTECTPQDKRGKVLVSLQIMFIFGRMWIVGLGFIFFESISVGNWRAIAIMNTLPCLICFIGSIFYVEESARFLISTAQFEEGFHVVNKMGFENNKDYVPLTNEETDSLKLWQKTIFAEALTKKSVMGLFNQQNLRYTWRIWVLGIILSVIFGAIYLLLPFILADEEKTLMEYLYIVLIEIPAVVIVYCLIDSPKWGGRKVMTIFGLTMQGIFMFIVWYFEERFLISGIVSFEFFARVTYLAFVPLVTESYNTIYRSMGIGAVQCITRISGTLAPLIFFPIYLKDKYIIFLYGTMATICMIPILITYPTDLTLKPLDLPIPIYGDEKLSILHAQEQDEKTKHE